ncbi:MAG: hypothetical protein ACON38_02165, partial [Akkermansiaceae bacterium]
MVAAFGAFTLLHDLTGASFGLTAGFILNAFYLFPLLCFDHPADFLFPALLHFPELDFPSFLSFEMVFPPMSLGEFVTSLFDLFKLVVGAVDQIERNGIDRRNLHAGHGRQPVIEWRGAVLIAISRVT